jgi:hypothetical protein
MFSIANGKQIRKSSVVNGVNSMCSKLSNGLRENPEEEYRDAVLEGYWEEVPELRGVLVPLIVNQTIYLLTQSDQKEARHERDNLERLIDLLRRYGTLGGNFPHQHQRLTKAFDDRLKGTAQAGVWASEDELEDWKMQLVYSNDQNS